MWVFTQNMYQKCVKTHIFHLWGKFHKQFLCYYCLIRIKYAKKSSISTRIAVTVTVWAQKGLEDRSRKCNIFQPIFQPFLLSSHRCHWQHGLLDCVYSPTDCTEFTKLLAENILPQISQNPQNFLLRMFSHRFHRLTQKLGCLQGGALVSSAPTE